IVGSSGSIASASVSISSGATVTVLAGGSIGTPSTFINNGTVVLNNTPLSLGSVAGNGTFSTNATLTLTGAGTFAGRIRNNGGPGNLAVTGGDLILTGNSDYTGATTISNGTLLVGNGSNTGSMGTGNVVNNTTLTFNRNDSHTAVNNISGPGQ